MKYFLDTEFIEGPQQKRFFGIPFGETKPTIDLISIGVVSEDEREYYAVSKDFNLKEAWNRYQLKQVSGDARNRYPDGIKQYWIRENVLEPIFNELYNIYLEEVKSYRKQGDIDTYFVNIEYKFTYSNFKKLLNKYGKTNKQIAKEIYHFINPEILMPNFSKSKGWKNDKNPEFYAYYADYDWVVFCWLFGLMNDLPKSFPMYCRDLKQMLDDAVENEIKKQCFNSGNHTILSYDDALKSIKKDFNYPKQQNEHNALEDARWNKKLYNFLNKL
jgi:hypothetical protein